MGVLFAAMLCAMSIPLGIIPFHLSLAVLTGILIGPWLGFSAVFVIVFFLALLGHGGLTVVGINALVVGSEAIFGYYFFKLFSSLIKNKVAGSAISTVLSLAISITLLISIISIAQINPDKIIPEKKAPFLQKEGKLAVIVQTTKYQPRVETLKPFELQKSAPIEQSSTVTRFAGIVLPIALLCIIIESAITSLTILTIKIIKPALLDDDAVLKIADRIEEQVAEISYIVVNGNDNKEAA